MEEIKSTKDAAVKVEATGNKVGSEIDPNQMEKEKELQKRNENEPTGKEEKVESALVTEEDYVSRSEATELTKEFFRNNLEDSDCRTFITTRGEVIFYGIVIGDHL